MCRDLTNSARRRVGSDPPAAARTSVYQFALVTIKNPIFSTSCVMAYRAAPPFGMHFALILIEEWRHPQNKL